MTQEEAAAWIAAGAAVAQAVGAIAAIWASFRIATRAEQRSADAVRQAAERERAAEAASVARAEAAERRAEEREAAANAARTRQERGMIASLVSPAVDLVLQVAESRKDQAGRFDSLKIRLADTDRLVELIDGAKKYATSAELFSSLLKLREIAITMSSMTVSEKSVGYCDRAILDLTDAMDDLASLIRDL